MQLASAAGCSESFVRLLESGYRPAVSPTHERVERVLDELGKDDLPAVRLPSGQIRYRSDQLEEWLTERSTGSRSEPAAVRPPN